MRSTGLKQGSSETQRVLANAKVAGNFVPICCVCRKIRTHQGQWMQIDLSLFCPSELRFTHGMCPGCIETLYPEFSVSIEH